MAQLGRCSSTIGINDNKNCYNTTLFIELLFLKVYMADFVDNDPQETQEWLDSLESIIEVEGGNKAHHILEKLIDMARRSGINLPYSANTAYVNSIPVDQQQRIAGDPEMEHKLRSYIRWNAMAMVTKANLKPGAVGGHIASFSSAATLYDVGFNHFFKGDNFGNGADLVFFQGHSSPGIYARSFLEGRLTEKQLLNFRFEADGEGLSSYPHPWLMPDYWQFPTVSMGLGPILAIYQARFMKYMGHREIRPTEGRNVWAYLGDGEIARIKKDEELDIKTIANVSKTPFIQELELSLEAIEKGGYSSFMLKEIFEQPKSVIDTLRGRINPETKEITLGGISDYEQKIMNADRIIIVACGTSWHAGLIGEYLFEDLARISVEVEYASEFRYRNPIINEKDVVLAISQSGETADSLAALELAKEKGATLLGICNVVGSSIPRLTHAGSYTHAGPEIGVASTKAFTTQIIVLTLMAIKMAHKKGTITKSKYHEIINELELIPEKIEKILKKNDQIEKIAAKFKDATNFLYLGRGYNFPVALEGALKLKEISYIHAEGYPAAEMKHGPIALIDDEMPIVVIATKKGNYDKVVSNIQEVKARGGRLIAIVTEGDKTVKELADYCIEIPACLEQLTPLLTNIPLQLLSYHIALMRGCNVDMPRNLAKSVTVE